MKNKQITIIGGYGLMGTLFSRLFSSLGHKVHKIGADDWVTAEEKLEKSDLVIISVPINLTPEIVKRTVPLIPKSCILADFTSVKTEPMLLMLSKHHGPVVGLHPMFGPTITSTNKQVIVYCDGREQESYQWLLDDFTNLGFTLKNMQATNHDLAMNFIQGVEHFLTFSLGTFLCHKNQHPEKLLEIASPIYLAKLLLLGRIFDQDPALYADIVMATPERIKLIKEFADWLSLWVNKLEENNKQEFITEFTKASQWMGKFTSEAQKISDNFLATDFIS